MHKKFELNFVFFCERVYSSIKMYICGKQIANDAVFCQYCGKPVLRSGTFAELISAARTGSQDAVGALYEKTYSSVYDQG